MYLIMRLEKRLEVLLKFNDQVISAYKEVYESRRAWTKTNIMDKYSYFNRITFRRFAPLNKVD